MDDHPLIFIFTWAVIAILQIATIVKIDEVIKRLDKHDDKDIKVIVVKETSKHE